MPASRRCSPADPCADIPVRGLFTHIAPAAPVRPPSVPDSCLLRSSFYSPSFYSPLATRRCGQYNASPWGSVQGRVWELTKLLGRLARAAWGKLSRDAGVSAAGVRRRNPEPSEGSDAIGWRATGAVRNCWGDWGGRYGGSVSRPRSAARTARRRQAAHEQRRRRVGAAAARGRARDGRRHQRRGPRPGSRGGRRRPPGARENVPRSSRRHARRERPTDAAEPETPPHATRRLPGRRLPAAVEEIDRLAVEEPLEIRVNGRAVARAFPARGRGVVPAHASANQFR